MLYHPHNSIRDFLKDYLTILDAEFDPVKGDHAYDMGAVKRAGTSPWKLCMPMSDEDWMIVIRPMPVEDKDTGLLAGRAVAQMLANDPVFKYPINPALRNDPDECTIFVPSISENEEDVIDALEQASRIYTRILSRLPGWDGPVDPLPTRTIFPL